MSPPSGAGEKLPGPLERRRRRLEMALGRPVVVRGVRTPDSGLQGRLRVESDRVVVEYQVAEPGYFWHIPIIERLFSLAEQGESRAELRRPDAACEERQEGK